jgi:regulation of enolase protein 1 (concanavalin A-like superfamily)
MTQLQTLLATAITDLQHPNRTGWPAFADVVFPILPERLPHFTKSPQCAILRFVAFNRTLYIFPTAVFASLFVLVASSTFGDEPRDIASVGTIIDPDNDCTIRDSAGKLVITVPGKAHDFAAELERWNAPRVLSDVQGDFTITVKISGKFAPADPSTIDGRKAYNGAGILVVVDDHNHLSLQRGTFSTGNGFRHYLNFELRKNSECTVSKFGVDIDNTDAFLRLERVGNQIYGLTSSDGVHWRSYEPITVDFPSTVKVGVEAINSASSEFSCAFEGYKVVQASREQTAKLRMSLVDAKGKVVKNYTQNFAVTPSGNNVMTLPLPESVGQGKYSVKGELAVNGVAGQVPAGTYTVASQAVILSAVNTNGFALQLTGPVGSNFTIEASYDLSAATNWQPILYFTMTNSPAYFSDPTTSNYQQRFYRALMK